MIVAYASSHGWGHNARLLPIINQLYEYPVEYVTTAPDWFVLAFLTNKRKKPINIRQLMTDPGCIQSDPFTINYPATIEAWKENFNKKDEMLKEEVEYLKKKGPVRLIVTDISYFGQLVAEALGVPSICIATFDWQFIYQNALDKHPNLANIISQIQDISVRFDQCIIPGSICSPLNIGKTKVKMHWSSRKPTLEKAEMRKKLNLEIYMDSVLLSFGGHMLHTLNPKIWEQFNNIMFFVLMPRDKCGTPPAPNVFFLPSEEWSKYHADLVNTVDVVIGKVGYGLCSEIAACRTRFLNVARVGNPESEVLTDFITSVVPTITITPQQFENGEWYPIYQLMDTERSPEDFADVVVDGEVQIARHIRATLGDKEPPKLSLSLTTTSILIFLIAVIYYALLKMK